MNLKRFFMIGTSLLTTISTPFLINSCSSSSNQSSKSTDNYESASAENVDIDEMVLNGTNNKIMSENQLMIQQNRWKEASYGFSLYKNLDYSNADDKKTIDDAVQEYSKKISDFTLSQKRFMEKQNLSTENEYYDFFKKLAQDYKDNKIEYLFVGKNDFMNNYQSEYLKENPYNTWTSNNDIYSSFLLSNLTFSILPNYLIYGILFFKSQNIKPNSQINPNNTYLVNNLKKEIDGYKEIYNYFNNLVTS